MKYVTALVFIFSALAYSAPKSKIESFLEKTGYENKHLIRLASGAYRTLDVLRDRVVETAEKLKSPNLSQEARRELETLLRRAESQYRLAFAILRVFARMSITEFDLRHLQESPKTKHLFKDQTPENDKEIKRQVMNRAAEFYVGYIALQALKQPPVAKLKDKAGNLEADIFKWLDRKEFALGASEDEMVYTFFKDIGMDDLKTYLTKNRNESPISNKRYPIELFRDTSKDKDGKFVVKPFFVIPTAINVANGFKALVNSEEAKALDNYNLSEPTEEMEEGLAGMVLKKKAEDKRLRGYVTLYLDVLGTLVDAYNDFTHDSYDLNRVTLSILFRHVLDIEGIEGKLDGVDGSKKDGILTLEEAEKYQPFSDGRAKPALGLTQYVPVRNVVLESQQILKGYFIADTEHGPRLSDKFDNKIAREEEYRTYHGSLLKDMFGKDVRHWIWPLSKAVKNKKGVVVDPRVGVTVDYKDANGKRQWQGRDKNWNAPEELAELQDGDLWTEKGTGMGSDLIALATEPASPDDRTKVYITQPSVWGVVKGKLYYKLTGALGWLGEKGEGAQFAAKLVKPTEYPGKNVDYNGISHTGIVQTYMDPSYPQLSRADFVDAFPNMMRQAWRGHGCGHRHSRKCVWFRLREDWADNYVKNFEQNKLKLVSQEIPMLKGRVHWYRSLVITNSAEESENLCHAYLTKTLKWTNEEEMMADREHQRPAYNYCLAVLKARGMRNFENKVLSQQGAKEMNANDAIKSMGKLVVETAANIRNQRGFERGFGTRFDDRFDSLTKGQLYCSEHAAFAYLLAVGADVYPESNYIKPARKLLSMLSEEWVSTVSNGFIKVPYGDNDRVYAPQELFTHNGLSVWRVIGEMRRGYFGEHDE